MHSSLVRARVGALIAVVVPALVATTEARAVGTRTFVLDTLEKLEGGELDGVAISSDGSVHAGVTLGAVPIAGETTSFSGLSLADGKTLIGTSPNGKIYELSGDALTLFADTGALAVTSIVQAKGGAVFAATIPDGKIFRVARGKADTFATLPDGAYVWALALDRQGTGVYAATGPEGKIFHVDASGRASVYYDASESHVVSLALEDDGNLLAGTSGKAQLLRVSGPGRAKVLATLPGDEVKGIAAWKGQVWAIANDYGEPPEPPKRSANAGRTPSGPSNPPKAKPGKGVLVRFDAQGLGEQMMKHDDTHYMALAIDEQGRPYVGTGAEGRVYTVDDAHVVTLVADTDERQVGALAISNGRGFIATSDPPVVHRIIGRGGPNAIWTSKPLDAGLVATFGTLTWRASGPLEFATRVGNSATPDETWSPWTAPKDRPSVIGGRGSRFVQVRARWARDPNAVLREVTVPFITENVRPIVTEVTSSQKAAPAKEPATTIPQSGGELGKHESTIKLTWKVDNPDNDALRYRVAFKRDGQAAWREAIAPTDIHTKAELEWDTAALPEGTYRVRVQASDELANPPDRAKKHELVSEAVIVDNTPPRIENLQLSGRHLHVRVIDGVSPIARVEVAIDGNVAWTPLAATDGVFDTPDESVDADVAALVGPGSHLVVVRAFDRAGNAVTRDIEAR